MKSALVLASASPRRQELLRHTGVPFVVQAANVPEAVRPGESPRDYAQRLAREKAVAVSRQRRDDFVLGADTIVVVEREILGKPVDVYDTARMLRLLSGRIHEVITGVCLVGPGGSFEDTRCESTRVTMNNLSHAEIHSYIETGEPMDKAGAYGIQGIASRWIPKIEGDYFNVMGLPVSLVYTMLREHGCG
jgi:septum formation protein